MTDHNDKPDTDYILENHIGLELCKIRIAIQNLTCILHSMHTKKPFLTYKEIGEEIGNE